MRVEVNVLGPLAVSVGGVSVVPTARKPSQLLDLLALNVGHVVKASELMEELWEQRPPRSAVSTLQTYILQLRRKLRPALPDSGWRNPNEILITNRVGYVLDLEPEDVDAVRYDRLASLGRHAVNTGDDVRAELMLREAQSLWRGPALADLPTGPHLAIEALRLEESRLSDLELRIDAELRLGRHRQLLGELASLCARHPMLENFGAQYMLALYRSGRQWHALQVYRGIRENLVDQLGVEPSARLQQLQQAMLSADPAIDDPTFVSSGWVGPAQQARL